MQVSRWGHTLGPATCPPTTLRTASCEYIDSRIFWVCFLYRLHSLSGTKIARGMHHVSLSRVLSVALKTIGVFAICWCCPSARSFLYWEPIWFVDMLVLFGWETKISSLGGYLFWSRSRHRSRDGYIRLFSSYNTISRDWGLRNYPGHFNIPSSYLLFSATKFWAFSYIFAEPCGENKARTDE